MKILLTHDGSEMADVAVPRTEALAAAAGPDTSVTALCITAPGSAGAATAEAERSIDRIGRALEAHGVQSVTREIREGAPGPLILETAQQIGADLLAMSTSGHSGQKTFIGSVADYVARNSSRVPVMLCRPEPVARVPFKSLLVPLDGDALGEGALRQASRLASLTDANVTLLRITDGTEELQALETPAGYRLGDLISGEAVAQVVAAEHESAEAELDEHAARLRMDGVEDVTVVVKHGAPGDAIIETAALLGCDTIVLSPYGRGSSEGERALGSVAEHVLRHVADAAVVIVPPVA